MSNDILQRIATTLEERRTVLPEDSYVASLYSRGNQTIIAKILEEAQEVADASNKQEQQALIHEVADLWFHCQVLLAYRQIDVSAVLDELERRFGTSGLEEKKNRQR